MRALSLWQPWASLIAIGAKTIETRSWGTAYRGPLAIHAAKKSPGNGEIGSYCWSAPAKGYSVGWIAETDGHDGYTNEALPSMFGDPLPLGAVVATCELVDCLPITGWVNGHPDWRVPGAMAATKVVAICDDDPDDRDEKGNPFARVWTYGTIRQGGRDLGIWSSGLGESPAYGDYTPGRFGWVLDKVQAIEPVQAKGMQGLWEWTP